MVTLGSSLNFLAVASARARDRTSAVAGRLVATCPVARGEGRGPELLPDLSHLEFAPDFIEDHPRGSAGSQFPRSPCARLPKTTSMSRVVAPYASCLRSAEVVQRSRPQLKFALEYAKPDPATGATALLLMGVLCFPSPFL